MLCASEQGLCLFWKSIGLLPSSLGTIFRMYVHGVTLREVRKTAVYPRRLSWQELQDKGFETDKITQAAWQCRLWKRFAWLNETMKGRELY